MTNDFVFRTTRSEKLRITAYGIDRFGSVPCIILVHGFKGFKDWGFGPHVGKFLSENGFFVLSFNFSHNGTGESLTEFTELDKFAENTFSLEVSELSELIDAYFGGFFGKIVNRKLGLIGHSRGGAISLLTCAQKKEVNAVTVWASVARLDRYSERQKAMWRKKGVFEVLNSRTKQVMRLNLSLLEDIENNKDKLNIEKAVKDLNRPLMIIHGEQDLAVPVKEAEKIYEWSDKSLSKLIKVPATGHTFDAQHPFKGSNPKLDLVIASTVNFFKKNLI